MFVFPNPYAHIDHMERLAGAFPHVPPMRGHVGAEIDRKHAEETYEVGDEDRGISPRADRRFMFASEAIEVFAKGGMAAHFVQAVQGGNLIEVKAVTDKPIDKLAAARNRAIASYVAHYGEEPDMSEWVKQFALDGEVAKRAAEMVAKPAEPTSAESKPAESKPKASNTKKD